MNVTESFSLDVKGYCEYCPNFTPYSDNIDITTLDDLPNNRTLHVIKCEDADKCELIRARMKAEMEAKREETEKVQCNVRGCENERPENGTAPDNGQSDGGETGVSDVREKEDQCNISKGGKGRWQDRLRDLFLRTN